MDVDFASHRRLPSIQNILSGPPSDLSRDAPRDYSRRPPPPPQYSSDPFRPATSTSASTTIAPLHPPTPKYHPQNLPEREALVAQAPPPPSLITRSSVSLVPEEPSRYAPAPGNAPSVCSYPPSLTHSGPTSPNSVTRPNDAYHTSPSSLEARSQNDSSPGQIDATSSGHASPKPSRAHLVRFVQGHGDCYVMPDGTYMPCQINGDPVNPEFGVTKAGKPRKRLAQACMTCREKKIKCQPGEPKCQQCTKLNRECKRPTTQQSLHPKDTPSAEVSVPAVPVARRFDFPTKTDSPPLLSKKRSPPETVTENPIAEYSKLPIYEEDVQKGPKRQRSGFDPAYGDNGFNRFEQHPTIPRQVPSLASGFDNAGMDLSEDPFEKDPPLAVEFLDLYFLHRGQGLYEVLPQEAFMQWVVRCRNKRRDEKMMLYILMAVGSRFCKDRRKKNIGTKYAKKAAFMERESVGENTLQLAQTRLYFLLYCFANGDNAEGWDYLCAGMGTCNALGLNTEDGVNDVGDDASLYDYGFTRYQLTECRRRTFFAGYCMDRYIGHNSGHSCLVHDDDVFLHLPGQEAALRKGDNNAQPGPLFSEGQVCGPFTEALGSMAVLIPIVSVWGSVVAHAWRCLHRRTKHDYLPRYEEHYAKTYHRIAAWEEMLPEHLRFTPQNTAAAVQKGCASAYFVLHSIRFVALIKLNRNANVECLPAELQSHNISRALLEAHNLLSITSMLSRNLHVSGKDQDFDNALSQPFPGYATLAACEVLSAGGSLQNRSLVAKILGDACIVTERIGRFWFAGGKQQAKISKLLLRIDRQEYVFGIGPHEGLWRLPILADDRDFFPDEYDLIHKSPRDIFYEAVARVDWHSFSRTPRT